MENFQVMKARSPGAKLWCEKWDVKNLMALKKQGPITQDIESQMTQRAAEKMAEIEDGAGLDVEGKSVVGLSDKDYVDYERIGGERNNLVNNIENGCEAVNLGGDFHVWPESLKLMTVGEVRMWLMGLRALMLFLD